jgi:hypothetical protein
MLLGGAVAVAPASALRGIAGEDWEVGLIRFAGALAVAVAALWPWARRHGSWQIQGLVVLAWLLVGVYGVSASEFALVMAFCILAAVAANLAVGRGFAYTEEVRRRLDDRT